MIDTTYPTRQLCRFVADLEFRNLPAPVVEQAKDLFIDWLGSALAGRDSPAVRGLEQFAAQMGPSGGKSTILTSRRKSSPYFAALINGASSHVVEQDDVHNASVFHPAAVVFPAVLAMAEDLESSGRHILEAIIAGYEVGIRVGEALGRSHYEIFHTTGTAGTLAAAAAVGKLLRLDEEKLNHTLGTAGTQAAGLWEFLRDAAHSKQIHTAKAATDGLLSAVLAKEGVEGAKQIIEGSRGMAAGMSRDADMSKLTDRLGTRWAICEMSLKWHASCRHTHPAADALQRVMQEEGLTAADIRNIDAYVHQGAVDVLGAVTHPATVHQAKFCMASVLGLIAVFGRADLAGFDSAALTNDQVRSFLDRVTMTVDPEINAAYPRKWMGKVGVVTTDGRELFGRVEFPKGDPENPLSKIEIEEKALRLADYKKGASASEMRGWIDRIQSLEQQNGFAFL